jgi:predicted phosphate transport protein (TIGR00153 family)
MGNKNPVVRAFQAVIRSFQPPAEKFYNLFEQASKNVTHGTELLKDIFDNYESVPEKVAAVKAAEQEGDRITQEIMRRLDRQFVTPLDREDISELAQCLDDVLDLCEAVATRVQRFDFAEPTAPATQLCDILVRSAREIEHVVCGLENIGHDHSHHWRSIHLLENEADEIERAALAGELARAIHCIDNGTWRDYARAMVLASQWGEIYERLERATDRCEDAANVLETLSAKYG